MSNAVSYAPCEKEATEFLFNTEFVNSNSEVSNAEFAEVFHSLYDDEASAEEVTRALHFATLRYNNFHKKSVSDSVFEANKRSYKKLFLK